MRLFRFIFLLVSCVLLFARCTLTPQTSLNSADSAPITAYVCIDLPIKHYELASEGVREWNNSIKNWKRLVPVLGIQEKCDYTIQRSKTNESGISNAVAWTNKIGGTKITLLTGEYEKDTKGIVIHEIGHALGAQHVLGTLMDPDWTFGGFVCPDITTVLQVAAWNKVNITKLLWCNGVNTYRNENQIVTLAFPRQRGDNQ